MKRIVLFIIAILYISITMAQQIVSHTVQRGETFELIAKRYNISLDELLAVNPDQEGCFVGMEINIPEGSKKSTHLLISTSQDVAMLDNAASLVKRGKNKKATSIYSDVIKQYPTASAYFGRGISYYNREKYKSAIEDFKHAQNSPDCTEDIKERCNELISKAESLREEKHERRSSIWGNIASAFVGAAALTATAYVASEQSKTPNTYNQPYMASGTGSSHLSRSNEIIAQSQTQVNQILAQGNMQLQQMTQQTMMQAQAAKNRSDQAFKEQMEWAGDFNKKNGRYPTEFEIDQWYSDHYPDLLHYRIMARGKMASGESDFDKKEIKEEYKGELSSAQYEARYRRYESLVEGRMRSLTIGGYQYEDKNGNKKGKVDDIKGYAYMDHQMGMKDAQREMKRIREEAAKYGVHITPSKWETATASY